MSQTDRHNSQSSLSLQGSRGGGGNEDEVCKKKRKKKKSDPLWREIDFIWFYFGLFLKNVLKGTVRTVFSKELKWKYASMSKNMKNGLKFVVLFFF